jgi:hypothetical protein
MAPTGASTPLTTRPKRVLEGRGGSKLTLRLPQEPLDLMRSKKKAFLFILDVLLKLNHQQCTR